MNSASCLPQSIVSIRVHPRDPRLGDLNPVFGFALKLNLVLFRSAGQFFVDIQFDFSHVIQAEVLNDMLAHIAE